MIMRSPRFLFKPASLFEHFGITFKEVVLVGISRSRDSVLERIALLEVYR